MIKVAIAGADDPLAGELVRILINHPEVDLRYLIAPSKSGLAARAVHHGLIGENPPAFCTEADWSKTDLLFVTDPTFDLGSVPEEVKIVDLSGRAHTEEDWVFGLSEIFRKALVRGATKAYVPEPLAAVALIALFPVARLLPEEGTLKIGVSGRDSADPKSLDRAVTQIAAVLNEVKPRFDTGIETEVSPADNPRHISVSIEFPTAIGVHDILPLFEQVYDDHNFTHLSSHMPHPEDVAGTHKCLLHVEKPTPEMARVSAVADPRMRGGVGEAIHLMNLLCGLYEKTGLTFHARVDY